MKKLLLLITIAALLLFPQANFGQAPNLRSASSFALFTAAGAFTNVGPTLVNGDIGTNVGAVDITGLAITGNAYWPGSPIAALAATDVALAYGELSTLAGTVLGTTLGSGQVITPGIYDTGAASTIDGILTLDGEGDPDALFIIRIGGALATGNATNIVLINGASPNNVYWQVMGQFDLGDSSVFRGTVIADGAISLLGSSTLIGRGLSVAGAISLFSNTVNLGTRPLDPLVDLIQPTCAEATGTITVTSPTGIGMTYSIDGSDYTNTTGIFTLVLAGDYTVTAKDIDGYISSGTVVTINDQPPTPDVPLATLTQPDCLVSTGTIEVTSPLGSTLEYSIDGTNWQSTTTFGGLVADATYTVYVQNTDDLTCTSQDDFIIDAQPPIPVADAGLDREICLSSSTQIGAVPVLGSTYSWTSAPAGFTSFVANPTVTPLVTTIYTLVETFPGAAVPGCSNTNDVTVTVNTPPITDPVDDQIVCNNTSTAEVIFSSSMSGTVFDWTNDQPIIGLAASGSGDIPAFTAINDGTVAVVATITVTPTANNCPGLPTSFTITVNPTPTTSPVPNQVVCNDNLTNEVGFSGGVSGTVFNWTNDLPTIGLAASGSGDILAFTAINGGMAAVVATITVTPTANNCPGSPISFTITVNPTPTISPVADQVVCDNSLTAAVIFSGGVSGTVFNWTNDQPSIGLAASGKGNIPAFTATISGGVAVVATITVTPIANKCPGPPTIFTITVIPPPTANAGPDAVICETGSYTLSQSSADDYTSLLWTTSGTGVFNDPAELHPEYVPSTTDISVGSVTLTLTATGTGPCGNASDNMLLTIMKVPVSLAGPAQNLCVLTNITLNANDPAPGTGLWTLVSGPNTPVIINPSLFNTGLGNMVAGNYVFKWTVSNGICTPAESTVNISLLTGSCSGLTLTKSAVETSFSAVGNVIHYTILVSNDSPANIYNITVTDPNATIVSGNPVTLLAPGTSATINATHTITQADLNAGQVTNCANASGSYSGGFVVAASSNCVTVTGFQRPQITITKFATEPTFQAVGEVIHYTLEIFNCGTVTVSNIVISDPNAMITGGNPILSLAPRQTVTATARHIVTQADLDSGSISNIAYANGVDPQGRPVKDDSNEVVLYSNMPNGLLVALFAEDSNFGSIGDTIHYLVAVKNFMTTRMSDILISSSNAVISSGTPIFRLESGMTELANAYHIVKQQDLDAGKVSVVVSARGKDYYDAIGRATSNEVTVFGSVLPNLLLTKTSKEDTYSNAGDLIHYTNEVRNTGNVRITGIVFSDPNTTINGLSRIAGLDPGESATILSTHLISQSDLNIGEVTQTASILGYDPNRLLIQSKSNQLIAKGIQNARFTIGITAAESGFGLEGDKLHYTTEIRNTGNVSITNIKVIDKHGVILGSMIAVLAPGNIAVIRTEHLINRSDLTSGSILNQVEATGFNPAGEKITIKSNTLSLVSNSSDLLIVTKIPQESTYSVIGEAIRYSVTLRNNGKAPLSNVLFTVPDGIFTANPTISTLSPSASVSFVAIHKITQSDLDAGQVKSDATISGKYANGSAFSVRSNPVTVYGMQNPEIRIDIAANESSFETTGQEVTYAVKVKNTGNVSISGIFLESQTDLAFTGSTLTDLAPGASTVLNARYNVRIEDMDAGKIITGVTAGGKDPVNRQINAVSNEVTIPGLQKPALFTISSALESTYNLPGDVIHYRIFVKNSGNVSIISTAVTDPNAVIVTARPNTILLPGESFTATAMHIITEQDIFAGRVVSGVKAEGFDLNGKTITKTGNKVTVFGIQDAELLVETWVSDGGSSSDVKPGSGDAAKAAFKNAGDILTFMVSVRNTGNITMHDILVSDAKGVLNLRSFIASLAPGQSATVMSEYSVVAEDVLNGNIVVTPIAGGFDVNRLKSDYTGNSVTVSRMIEHFNLSNFPNPFAYSTTITFELAEKGDVILKILDLTGREVGQIEQRNFNTGRNEVIWNTASIQKGQYILKMIQNGNQATRLISVIY